MLIKIIGCKGNSYIDWTLDFLRKEYQNYSPINILFFYSSYYYPLKDKILQYNLDAQTNNFYTYFTEFVGIENHPPNINKVFWERAKTAMGKFKANTIVVIDSHDLSKPSIEFIKNFIDTKNLILAGDPNISDYPENWGQNYLKDFQADIFYDLNQFYHFPIKIYNEIIKILPQMKLNGIQPYIPKLRIADYSGEVTEVKKEFLFSFLKEVNLGKVLIASKYNSLKHKLFNNNIAYRDLNQDKIKIPVQLFKYTDTLEAINQEKRMISCDEILRIIKLTRAEIVQRFGGRKLLNETFEPVKEIYAKGLKRSGLFEYLTDQLIKDRIEYCLTPVQSTYYKKWKNNIKNKEWIAPQIYFANPLEVKFGEFDTVITEKFTPNLMWRVLLRAKSRIVYIK